jgi:hypothetical protein
VKPGPKRDQYIKDQSETRSHTDIGRELGLSRQRVSQIAKRLGLPTPYEQIQEKWKKRVAAAKAGCEKGSSQAKAAKALDISVQSLRYWRRRLGVEFGRK